MIPLLEPHTCKGIYACVCIQLSQLRNSIAIHFHRGSAEVILKIFFLYSELVAVDMSELSGEKTKQAEERHDQGPFTHSSRRGIA